MTFIKKLDSKKNPRSMANAADSSVNDRHRRVAVVALAAFGLGLAAGACAPTQPARGTADEVENTTAADDAAPPVDVKAMFAREFAELPPATRVHGQGWRAEVPGLNPKVGPAEGGEQLTISIGSSEPISCIVFEAPVHLASTVGKIFASVPAGMNTLALHPGVFVEKESPVYMVASEYVVDSLNERGVGLVKIAAVAHRERPLLCIHDEVGFTKTFERVVRALVASYHVEADSRAEFVSVDLIRANDVAIGFQQRWEDRLASGERAVEHRAFRLIPRSGTQLAATDLFSRVVVTGDRVKAGRWVDVDADAVTTRLELAATGKDRFRVEGVRQGKPISGEIHAPKGIPSDRATSARIAREVAKGKPFRFVQAEYMPSEDPVRLTENTYWREVTDAARSLHVAHGTIEFEAHVDDSGEPMLMSARLGQNTVVAERAYLRDDAKPGRGGKAGANQRRAGL